MSSSHTLFDSQKPHPIELLQNKLNDYTSDISCKYYPIEEIFKEIMSFQGQVSKSLLTKLKAKHFQCCAYQIAEKHQVDLDEVGETGKIKINDENVFALLRALIDFRELRDLLKISQENFKKAGLICLAEEMEMLHDGWKAALEYYEPPAPRAFLNA